MAEIRWWWQSPVQDEIEETQQNNRIEQAKVIEGMVNSVPQTAQNLKSLVDEHFYLPKDVLVGASLMNLTADSPEIATIVERWLDVEKTWWDRVKSVGRGTIRTAFTAFDSLQDEIVKKPVLAYQKYLNQKKYRDSTGILGASLQLLISDDARKELGAVRDKLGPSTGRIALQNLAAGKKVNLGEGYFPNSTLAEDTDVYKELVGRGIDDQSAKNIVQTYYGQDITNRERTYGLGTGKTKTVWKLGQIVNGHRVFFEALAHFLSNDNSLTIIPGNHDIEFHWEEVQNALREYIAGLFENTSLTEQQQQEKKESIKTRIEFYSWFYYNKKLKVYIEHGNQYDRLNSFEYFLYPRLEEDSDTLWLPFGSFFVRYFFNKLEASHPFADNIKPITKYAEWAWSEHKLELLKNIWRHFPTMYLLFQKRKRFSEADRLNDLNEEKLDKLSKELNQPLDAIKEINRLRAEPLTKSRLSVLLFFAGTIFFFFSLIALVVLIVLRIFYKFSLWTFSCLMMLFILIFDLKSTCMEGHSDGIIGCLIMLKWWIVHH